MSSEQDFLNKKWLKKLDRQTQEIIDRIGLDTKTQDEVFDKSTLLTLEKLISNKTIDIIDYPISTGKEGNVFLAITPDKKKIAVKIYRTSTSTFKHMQPYIIGDPRFQSIHKTRRDIIYAWTKKEYKNLQRLQKAGVNAPKPLKYIKNVLIMQYLGDSRKSAPLLKDTQNINAEETFKEIIRNLSLMYNKAEIVHGDLSQYNILIYRKKPFIIDLGQGVLLEHMNSDDFLRRDITNIVKYFKKYKIDSNVKKIYEEITNKQW